MKKPNSYDEVQVGEFTPIELGGHHAIIKNVKETQTKTGKAMIVVSIDFANNDKQPGYFMDQFSNDIRPEKKWPYQATQYIVTEDENGKCSRNFKSFITNFEDSNGCEAIWGEDFCAQFKNKRIGVVYGNVEEDYNGEVKMRRRIRWFCKDADVDTVGVPDDKLLQNSPSKAAAPKGDEGFMNITDGIEEIPF